MQQQQQQTNDPNDVVPDLTPQQRDQMIAENVASIEAVPQSVWESSCADPVYGPLRREWALYWARKGYDVYCYRGFGEHGVWNLWLAGQRIELGRAEGGAK